MSREDVVKLARDVGFKVGTNISGVQLVGAPMGETIAHLTVDELAFFYDAAFKAGAEAEREAICSIVYGLCISDNNAQEIVNAIRARATGKDSLSVAEPDHHVPEWLRREVERGNRAGGVG